MKDYAENADVANLLFRTQEGQAIFASLFPHHGPFVTDPVVELVKVLETNPSLKPFAIQLTQRLTKLLSLWEEIRIKLKIHAGFQGSLRTTSLRRLAENGLRIRTEGGIPELL